MKSILKTIETTTKNVVSIGHGKNKNRDMAEVKSYLLLIVTSIPFLGKVLFLV